MQRSLFKPTQVEDVHYQTSVFSNLYVDKDGILFMRTFCVVIGRGSSHCLSKGLLKYAFCITFHLELKFGLLLRVERSKDAGSIWHFRLPRYSLISMGAKSTDTSGDAFHALKGLCPRCCDNLDFSTRM